MGFITKIDSSNNRQIIQNILTQSYYSGSSIIGTSFNQLPSGVNLNQTGITSSLSSVTSTYTANTTASTMQVTFGNPNMAALYSALTVITTANTGTTQYLGPSFSATSSTVIDYNTVNLAWSGVSYTFEPLYNQLSGTTLYGTATSVVYTYTGGTLDYTGRTNWLQVRGIAEIDSKLGVGLTPDTILDINLGGVGRLQGSYSSSIPSLTLSGNSVSLGTMGVSESTVSASTIIGMRAGSEVIGSAYGKVLDGFLYSSVKSNGLNIISAAGTGTDDYIRMYAGTNANAASPDMHIQGSGATRGYVGIGTDTPTKNLDVNGELRVRTVGAGPGTSIAVDGSGNVVYTASDEKLKENIEVVESALEKVLKLRGVTFNWKDRDKGGNQKEIGFIAQEVQKITPELVFEVPNSDILAVKYENTVALLVEAIKEMDDKIINIDELAKLELLLPKSEYIPTSSKDSIGGVNSVVRDDNFLYIKTESGWVRSKLEKF